VTVAYFLESLGNTSKQLAHFILGLSHMLPHLLALYTDFGGLHLFLVDTLDSISYCFQPLLRSGHNEHDYLGVVLFHPAVVCESVVVKCFALECLQHVDIIQRSCF
jgi:hypothetical protein